jgi:spore germination protein GerM
MKTATLAVTACIVLTALLIAVGYAREAQKEGAPAASGAGGAVSTQTTEPSAAAPSTGTTDGPTGQSGPQATEPAPADTVTVTLYWISAGENALGVARTLPYTKAVARAALEALLAGPTKSEQATWPAISTAIPRDTRLLGITVKDGVARVDLSREFESGGGTFSMTARLAQVVYTLEQFPTIDAVEFYIEGKRVTVFSSEGVILDGPQRLEDFDDLVPIDA